MDDEFKECMKMIEIKNIVFSKSIVFSQKTHGVFS